MAGSNGNGNGSGTYNPQSLIQLQDMPNMMRSLVEPGSTIQELLMRSNLLDTNEATDLALAISFCEKYHCDRQLNTLLYLLASRCSVNESARKELLMALTGILSPGMLGYKDKSISNKSNRNQTDQNPPAK